MEKDLHARIMTLVDGHPNAAAVRQLLNTNYKAAVLMECKEEWNDPDTGNALDPAVWEEVVFSITDNPCHKDYLWTEVYNSVDRLG